MVRWWCSYKSAPNRCYFVLIRKGKFPRLCPAIIAEGARCPRPKWPQAPQAAQTGGRSHRLRPRGTAAVRMSQRRGWGRGSPLPQGLGPSRGWPWRGQWSPAGHRPQPVPWHPWPEARWAGGSWGEGQDLSLSSFSAWRPPLLWELAEWATNGVSLTVAHVGKGPHSGANWWLSRITSSCSLRVACLGEEPTEVLTNGWAGPLMVPW